MRVVSIKSGQKSPKFKANIKFVQTGSKNLLSKQSMEILTQKAKTVSRATDLITIRLSQEISKEFGLLREDSLKYYTKISGEFGNESKRCYPFISEIGNVCGNEEERKNKSFIMVDHFIDMIKDALK